MTVEQDEILSAYVDGELGGQDAHHLTQRLLTDRELRSRLGRYRLVGDSLRGELSDAPVVDVAADIAARLADEPTVLVAAAGRKRRARWLQPVAGVAVAASVAIAAVFVAPRFLGSTEGGGGPVQLASTPSTFAPVPGVRVVAAGKPTTTSSAAQSIPPQVMDRLNHYLIEHHEFSGRSGLQGPVPHASFVSYDGR